MSTEKFEISAGVVFALGQELITDVMQALVELVKNSYDADATWVHVTITTKIKDADAGIPETLGQIVVEDDGHGMGADDFRRGWLMIADSPKKHMKNRGGITELGRTPIGDKGLGRLGVQRLGYDVEIISRVTDLNAEEIRVAFSWHDFEKAKRLSDVPVHLEAQPRTRKRSGTRITVRDLIDTDQWTGEKSRSKLQRSLAELISPFKEVRDFSVTVTLDGVDVPIVEITERLREAASVRYEIAFDGSCLCVNGKARLNFVERAQKKEDQTLLQELLKKDEGQAFFDYLQKEETRGKPPGLEYHVDSKWFVTFRYDLELSSLGGVHLSDGEFATPGPFTGEIDYLLLDKENIDGHVWDSLGDFRSHVYELSGIRIYRDGFGIRVGDDWLGLGRQSTSGASLYGLRPKNVIGYVAISAQDNRVLLETTSREGFQKTPHYQNFYELLQMFVRSSSLAQEYLRRGALNFLKYCKAQNAGIEVGGEITSGVAKLREHATTIDRRGQTLEQARKSMKNLAITAQARVKEITADDKELMLFHQDKLDKITNLISDLGSAIEEIQRTLEEHQPEESNIRKAQQILDVVLERDERLRQELEMFYEGVALGLVAEVLSHEISSITDHLAKRSAALRSHLSKATTKDAKILGFVEHVKSSIAALRKQLAHLDPSLRYVREKREVVLVAHELEEVKDFYKARFSNHAITMLVQVMTEFKVKINRGKLSQIFDNILLNSEYWLRENRRKDVLFTGEIVVEVDRPFLRIWDNGPGIALSVQDNLFDPFVTTKEQGKGRGLGLFIVKQLLDAEHSTIHLHAKENQAGRRYIFEIDLGGALND